MTWKSSQTSPVMVGVKMRWSGCSLLHQMRGLPIRPVALSASSTSRLVFNTINTCDITLNSHSSSSSHFQTSNLPHIQLSNVESSIPQNASLTLRNHHPRLPQKPPNPI